MITSRYSNLREKIGTMFDATMLVLGTLLRYRMGLVLPVAVVMVLMAYTGMILELVSPLAVLPRAAQVTPFIYPLF
jgi:hypothetical protein